MPESKFRYAGVWLAAAVLTAGVLYSAHTARTTPRRLRNIKQKQDILTQLHGLQKIALSEQAAVQKFEQDASARP